MVKKVYIRGEQKNQKKKKSKKPKYKKKPIKILKKLTGSVRFYKSEIKKTKLN